MYNLFAPKHELTKPGVSPPTSRVLIPFSVDIEHENNGCPPRLSHFFFFFLGVAV